MKEFDITYYATDLIDQEISVIAQANQNIFHKVHWPLKFPQIHKGYV